MGQSRRGHARVHPDIAVEEAQELPQEVRVHHADAGAREDDGDRGQITSRSVPARRRRQGQNRSSRKQTKGELLHRDLHRAKESGDREHVHAADGARERAGGTNVSAVLADD